MLIRELTEVHCVWQDLAFFSPPIYTRNTTFKFLVASWKCFFKKLTPSPAAGNCSFKKSSSWCSSPVVHLAQSFFSAEAASAFETVGPPDRREQLEPDELDMRGGRMIKMVVPRHIVIKAITWSNHVTIGTFLFLFLFFRASVHTTPNPIFDY